MAIDVRKMKEQAAEFARNGKFEDAVKIFKTLVLADKKEVTHAVKIAELHVKLQQNDKAVQWYETAAKKYAEQGHLPKAIAMAKLILQIDPRHADTQDMLANLYAKKEGEVPNPLLKRAPAPVAAPAPIEEVIAMDEPEDKLVTDAVDVEAEQSFDLQNLGGEPLPSVEELTQGMLKGGVALDDAPGASEDEVELLEEVEVPIELLSDDDLRAEISVVDPRVLAQLPRVPLFSELVPEEFQRIIQHLEIRSFEPNEYVVTEGDPGDSFYVITQGDAVVVKEDYAGLSVELARLPEGSFFGEFAYLTDTPRTASVVASGALEVLELGRASLDALVQEHPRVKSVLQQFYRDRVLSTILAISPLFEPFSAEEKQNIIRQFKFAQAPADTVLIKQGTDGDGLYVILNGEVQVTKTDAGGEATQLAALRAGEFFGEMSLLNNAKTTATVSTTQKTALFKLPLKEFTELSLIYPALLGVLRGFAEERRLRNQALDAGFGESGLV